MYIKEVNITGFRSYRDTSVNEFSPRHNVIVGRNGSGKSNFFFAIQFVLSDEFAHLKTEHREGLIHEGTGERVTTARVEIVFDNSDRRIVAVESNEVRVMRQVSFKKDQYFIDSKMVTRSDVVNLMESAGFSRSNPYHIVKQGKINELATSPDSHRLKLLREVAGTRVYDERKEESLKILRETNSKSEKIENLLAYIEERLQTLEGEKEELKEYQKWDRIKRSIEYTIYDNEVKEARKKLDKLAEQREELNTRQSKVASELLSAQDRSMNVAAEQRKLEARFKGLRDEKEALLSEQTERVEKKTELELRIRDLREDVEKERSGRDKAEDVLTKLKADIAAKQEELNEITPKYTTVGEEMAKLNTDIRIMEQQYKDLCAKQGFRDHYKTVEERDKALSKEIRFYDRQLADTKGQIESIENSLQEEEQEEQELNAKIRELDWQAEECVDHLSKLNQEITDLRQRLDHGIVQQVEAAREERNARENLEAVDIEISQAEQEMRKLSARGIMNGVDSVRKVLQNFRNNNVDGQYDWILNGYHGILMELFACENIYHQAVEVTAGNRLFYHVVDDDRVAMKILKEVNQQKLLGEVNFFPLNRIIAKPKRTTNNPDARPIMDSLEFDSRYEVVFRHVFGGTAIVRNMLAGNNLARTEGFDCVTFEGDQINRRGPMTGGYLDPKRCRLELFSTIRNLLEQKKDIQANLEAAIQKNNERSATVEKLRMKGQDLEREVLSQKNDHKLAAERKRALSQQLQQSQRSREPKIEQTVLLKNRIREIEANRDSLQKQLGTPLLSQLTAEEQSLLNSLQADIKEKKTRYDNMFRERARLESVKSRLENQLTTNLLRKRESLQAKIQDISVDEKRNSLQAEMAELRSVNHRLSEIMTRLSELEERLTEYEQSQEKLTRELEDCQEQQKDLEAQVAEFSKQADVICTKQSVMQAKREDSMKKIRELGSLPMDAKNYESYSLKQLDKKLNEALEQLKKYENVNKRALDQYVQASSQKEELTRRMEEHKANQKAINELVNVLDHRKYEAIQLTFKQVSKNFKTVFQKLVPEGSGCLIMRTGGSEFSQSQPSGDSDIPIVETFTGIGIEVSFTGNSETQQLQQLSGGQKSLVALALIFAIQKCDPAPFYLFDEIDAALDAQHRKAVADMIHELSENAQFITTTFRAELLGTAEKYFGVRFRNKVSHIDAVTKEQAYDFVEDDQTHN